MGDPSRLLLDTRGMARVAAALWVGCGGLVVVGGALLPIGPGADRGVLVAIGSIAVLIGVVAWMLPWHRWHPRSTLLLVPLALIVIAAVNRAADDPWLYNQFFVVTFAWIGLAHRQGTPALSAPMLVVAYLLPLAGRGEDPRAVAALAYVLPTSVFLGEAAAWVAGRLRAAEAARAGSEARYEALVRHAADVVFVFDDRGQVTYASPALIRVLGIDPRDVIGRRGRELVHPDDLPEAVAWFRTARTGEDAGRRALYRLRHADGGWRWLEGTVNDLRSDPNVLGTVVNGRDVTERIEAERQLAHVAGHDSLTGLPNRTGFLAELDRALARGVRRGTDVGVLFLDLDGFKVVNDSLGHGVGDAFLVAVADRLRDQVRTGEYLARLGGDEFTIVIEDLGDVGAASALAGRIVNALREPVEHEGRRHVLTVSVGIAVSGPGELDASELLRRADLAMYRAKELGRSRFEVFDEPLAWRARRRMDVEAELLSALEREELVVHFQPEVDTRVDRIVGMEALVRWKHPSRGLLGPTDFIDVAEQSSLIVPLGTWVLRHACAVGVRWLEELGDAAPLVGVNVSPRQLWEPGFAAVVEDALLTSGLPPELLRLEINESLVVEAVAPMALSRVKAVGVEIAIDDFGTGYSSLSYLEQLPVDVLKIDRTFVEPVVSGEDRSPVVEATIALARSLGLRVVAAGVETPAQRAMLQANGCHRMQGFLLGRPVPVEGATELLRTQRRSAAPS